MLRRFASDCSCPFTVSQIAPENSPNVAISASATSLSDISIYAYIRLAIAAIKGENIMRLRPADVHDAFVIGPAIAPSI